MNYSNETLGYKKRLEDRLTNALKARITDLGLVNSGQMRDSTKAFVDFTDDGLSIRISSTDYFEFLDSDYDITDYCLDLPDISELLTDLYGEMVLDLFFND